MKIPSVSSQVFAPKAKQVEKQVQDFVPLFVKEDRDKNLPKKKSVILPMLAGLVVAASVGGVTAGAGKIAAKVVKHEISLSKTFNTLTNAVLKTVKK